MASRPRRRSSEAGSGWTYATDGKDGVLWYCPTDGREKDRCPNKRILREYWNRRYHNDKVPSHFTFRVSDAPQYFRRVQSQESCGEDTGDSGDESSPDIGTDSGDDDDDAREGRTPDSGDVAGSRKPKRMEGSSPQGVASPRSTRNLPPTSSAQCSPDKVRCFGAATAATAAAAAATAAAAAAAAAAQR